MVHLPGCVLVSEGTKHQHRDTIRLATRASKIDVPLL